MKKIIFTIAMLLTLCVVAGCGNATEVAQTVADTLDTIGAVLTDSIDSISIDSLI